MLSTQDTTEKPAGTEYSLSNGDQALIPSLNHDSMKKKFTMIFVAVAAAAIIIGLIIFIPQIKYANAQKALLNRDFDKAHSIFSSLNGYRDSSALEKESLYQKANSLLEKQQYDAAIKLFQELGTYSDAKNMVSEATYQKAKALQNDKAYKDAYLLFQGLDDYKQSSQELLMTIMLWEATALGSSSHEETTSFKETVTLSEDQYDQFYSTLQLFLLGHEETEFWYAKDSENVYSPTSASENVWEMLNILPASYADVEALKEVFYVINCFDEEWIYDLYPNHEPAMRQLYSTYGFIKRLSEYDFVAAHFLAGKWTGSGYYIQFTEQEEGGMQCSYTLPYVQEPNGTKLYAIENMTYYFDDANGNHLAKVFQFEMLDYDIMRVFCFKNGNSYTLYR